jgi:hypothetical protein
MIYQLEVSRSFTFVSAFGFPAFRSDAVFQRLQTGVQFGKKRRVRCD